MQSLELKLEQVLRAINELKEDVNMLTVIFKSDRKLDAQIEILDELETSLIRKQLSVFEDRITQLYDERNDMKKFYETIALAHQFGAEHGFSLAGGFHNGRYRFVQLPLREVACVN